MTLDDLYQAALRELARQELEAGAPLFGPEASVLENLSGAFLAPGTLEYLAAAHSAPESA